VLLQLELQELGSRVLIQQTIIGIVQELLELQSKEVLLQPIIQELQSKQLLQQSRILQLDQL